MGVVPGVDERDAEGPQAAVLRVALLEVAQPAHELLAGYVFVVGEQVALRGLAGVVDEDVGVGGHASDSTYHVAGDGQVWGRDWWREAWAHSFRM